VQRSTASGLAEELLASASGLSLLAIMLSAKHRIELNREVRHGDFGNSAISRAG